jgi:hypothetical protein
MGAVRYFRWLVLAAVCATGLAHENPSSDAQELRAAAHVFAGTVKSISREDGAVAITVQVDDAIKGVTSGTDFQWREWDGLWRSGPHYRKGERIILFLRPVATSGLTSPLRVLRVQADRVQLRKRSPRLGGSARGVAYADYIRTLRTLQ